MDQGPTPCWVSPDGSTSCGLWYEICLFLGFCG